MSWEPQEGAEDVLTLCQSCARRLWYVEGHAHNFCTGCGQPALITACPKCAEPINASSWFCGKCGSGLTMPTMMEAAGWSPRMIHDNTFMEKGQ